MEADKAVIPNTVTKVAKIMLPVLAAAYIVFLLITILGKPVYSPGAGLSIIAGGLAICTAISAILLILDYMGKESE
jgi:hypothetical protein